MRLLIHNFLCWGLFSKCSLTTSELKCFMYSTHGPNPINIGWILSYRSLFLFINNELNIPPKEKSAIVKEFPVMNLGCSSYLSLVEYLIVFSVSLLAILPNHAGITSTKSFFNLSSLSEGSCVFDGTRISLMKSYKLSMIESTQ